MLKCLYVANCSNSYTHDGQHNKIQQWFFTLYNSGKAFALRKHFIILISNIKPTTNAYLRFSIIYPTQLCLARLKLYRYRARICWIRTARNKLAKVGVIMEIVHAITTLTELNLYVSRVPTPIDPVALSLHSATSKVIPSMEISFPYLRIYDNSYRYSFGNKTLSSEIPYCEFLTNFELGIFLD